MTDNTSVRASKNTQYAPYKQDIPFTRDIQFDPPDNEKFEYLPVSRYPRSDVSVGHQDKFEYASMPGPIELISMYNINVPPAEDGHICENFVYYTWAAHR